MARAEHERTASLPCSLRENAYELVAVPQDNRERVSFAKVGNARRETQNCAGTSPRRKRRALGCQHALSTIPTSDLVLDAQAASLASRAEKTRPSRRPCLAALRLPSTPPPINNNRRRSSRSRPRRQLRMRRRRATPGLTRIRCCVTVKSSASRCVRRWEIMEALLASSVNLCTLRSSPAPTASSWVADPLEHYTGSRDKWCAIHGARRPRTGRAREDGRLSTRGQFRRL